MSNYASSRPRPTQDPINIAIVASLYNNQFVQGLLNAAKEEIEVIAPNASVDIYRVPGAFEIPVCVEHVLRGSAPDAVITLGVSASVTDALQQMAVKHCIPIIHEVLLVSTEEQAEERCLGATINRGTEAAQTCVKMINLFGKMKASFAGEPLDHA
jgi:6,7-dimethyl-8-ribityllumazine synthase